MAVIPCAATEHDLVAAAVIAEARHETRVALELLLRAERAGQADAGVLQRISRQYTDLIPDLATRGEQRSAAEQAVHYATRAFSLEASNPLHAASVAVSYGKLALLSGTREKVRLSRLVREFANRALALDPNYAWAHHVLGRWHAEVATLGAPSRAAVKLFYGGLPPATLAEAVRHLSRAVELEPHEVQHHTELGFALLADGNSRDARLAFERALALPARAKIDGPAQQRARAALSKMPK